jgi:hypothetical protein
LQLPGCYGKIAPSSMSIRGFVPTDVLTRVGEMRKPLIAGAIVCAIAAVLAVFWFNRDSDSPVTAASTPQPLTEQNATLLQRSLNSKDASVADAMVPPLRDATKGVAGSVLPNDFTLEVVRNSFAGKGEGLAEVKATVKKPGQQAVQAEFTLKLALTDGQWLIYETKRTR